MRIILFILFIFSSQFILSQDSAKSILLHNIEITAKKSNPERLNPSTNFSVFSGKKNDILKLDNLNLSLVTNNTRQLLSRVAGVTIWENDGSGTQVGISVRGLNPNRSWEINTRQNGYDISADIFGYPEAYYHPPMEAVDKIQLVRGGASLQYGSQFGGLLNYILKRPTGSKRFQFETQNTAGSYGLLSSYISIGGIHKKWSYSVYNQMRKAEGWRENGYYSVRNSHVFIQYKIDSHSCISAEYTNMDNKIQQSGGLTDNQFLVNSQQSNRSRNWMSTPWNLFNLNYNSRISKNLNFNLKLFGLIGERSSIGFIATPTINDTINTVLGTYNPRQIDRDKYQNFGLEMRNLYSFKFHNLDQKIAFGLRYSQSNTTRNQKGKGDIGSEFNTNLEISKYPTALDFKTTNFALFIENQIKLSDKFTINPGLRLEHIVSDISGRLNISNNHEINQIPTSTERLILLSGFGLQYDLEKTNIYGNFSQSFRPVLFSDLTPPSTTDIIDPNLKDASGYTIDLGYRGQAFDNMINFDASLFYLRYDNRIGTIRKFIQDYPANSTYLFRTNIGNTVHKGLELFIDLDMNSAFKFSKKKGSFHLFTSQSWIDARYLDFQTNSVSGVAPNIQIKETNLAGNQVEYAPQHISNFGLSYSNKSLSCTIQQRYTSAVYTDASNTELANSQATSGKINEYSIFDFSADYQFKKYLNLKLGIQNILDEKYATRRAGGYPGPGLISGEGRSFYFGFGLKL
jgi:Fe(3+) dicitrate transport protein